MSQQRVRITVQDKGGDLSLLIEGDVYDRRSNRKVAEDLRLQPGGQQQLELEPGLYRFEFSVQRHQGPFTVEVHTLVDPDGDEDGRWAPLDVEPGEYRVPPLTGHVARFEVD